MSLHATDADRSVWTSALIGASVLVGWIAFDFAVFLSTRRPEEALRLLPGGALAVLLAGLSAGVLHMSGAGRRVVLLLGIALALLAVRPELLGTLGVPLSAGFQALPCFVLFALSVWWGTLELSRRYGCSAVHVGFSGAVLVAAGHALLTSESVRIPRSVVVCAVPLFALAFASRGRMRLAVTAILVLAPSIYMARAARLTQAWLEPELALLDVTAPSGAPNALVIVLDTVRPDHMSVYGYERDTTPGLERFAREHATRYTQVYSTSPWTLPAHATLFTGLLPSDHGATRNRDPNADPRPYPVRPELPMLAERLRARGYRTGAIISNNVLGRWSGLDRGFAHYDDRKSGSVGDYLAFGQVAGAGELAGHKPYRDGRVITDLALEWLDGADGDAPFFLVLNYMDAHAPYSPEPPFDSLFADDRSANPTDPSEVELWPLLYDRELAYLDAHVTRLIEGLRERGEFENTLVIVTSDHGEAFGEHDVWSHEWALYEEFVRVPLLVKTSGTRREALNTEVLTLIDVHDLILRELGLTAADRAFDSNGETPLAEWYYSEGVQLPPDFPGIPRSERVRDLTAWRTDGMKLIVSSTGVVEAFDLQNDPAERSPLDVSSEVREAALERARAWWAAHPAPANSGSVDSDTLERLEELGYAGEN